MRSPRASTAVSSTPWSPRSEAVSELEVVTTEHAGHATELAAEVAGRRRRRPRRRRHVQRDRKRDPPGHAHGRPARRRVLGVRPPPGVLDRSDYRRRPSSRRGDPGQVDPEDRPRRRRTTGCSPSRPASASTPRRPRSSTSVRHERPGNERPGDLRVLATALGVLRKEGFALHERMTLRTADGDAAPVLVRGRGKPASVHVPGAAAGAGRAPGRLRARARRRLHPRAARPRPVAAARVRADLAAPRQAWQSPRRLPPRSAPVHDRVRRADRPPARRRVRGAPSTGWSSPTGPTRSRCSSHPSEHPPARGLSFAGRWTSSSRSARDSAWPLQPACSRPRRWPSPPPRPPRAGSSIPLHLRRRRHRRRVTWVLVAIELVADSVWPGAQAGVRLGRRIVAGGLVFEFAAGGRRALRRARRRRPRRGRRRPGDAARPRRARSRRAATCAARRSSRTAPAL